MGLPLALYIYLLNFLNTVVNVVKPAQSWAIYISDVPNLKIVLSNIIVKEI